MAKKKTAKRVETRGRKADPNALRKVGIPIQVLARPEQHARLTEAAAAAGMSLSAWLTDLGLREADRLLGKATTSK